jgi:hypothetical protein
MRLHEIKPLKESFVISKKVRKVKEYDYDIEDDIVKEVPYTHFEYKDIIGGNAVGELINDTAHIVGMDSVPSEYRFTADESKYKKRGFFKDLIKELYIHGVRTIIISIQSSDTRKAVGRLLNSNVLMNPRNYRGLSVDQFPTVFDINPDISK